MAQRYEIDGTLMLYIFVPESGHAADVFGKSFIVAPYITWFNASLQRTKLNWIFVFADKNG